MMLEVLAAFFGRIRRVGDRILYVFAADRHLMLYLIRHRVLGLAGRTRLASAHRNNGQSGKCLGKLHCLLLCGAQPS